MTQTLDHIPDLSVVVLCYRAGETAEVFAREVEEHLLRANLDYELVLVGNYWPDSDDDTPRIVERLAANNPRVQAITLPKEGAMGWDMRSGLAAARGRHIAVIDGDRQMLAGDVVRVYETLRREGLDMCKTTRIRREDGLYRRTISLGYNILFRILFPGIRSRDANAKPKLFTRAAYEQLCLTADDWFIDAEIMIQARRYKFRIGEVPTQFLKNHVRGSFVKLSANLEFLTNLFRYRWREFRAVRPAAGCGHHHRQTRSSLPPPTAVDAPAREQESTKP